MHDDLRGQPVHYIPIQELHILVVVGIVLVMPFRLVFVRALDDSRQWVTYCFITSGFSVVRSLRIGTDMVYDFFIEDEGTEWIWDCHSVQHEVSLREGPGNSIRKRVVAGLIPKGQHHVLAAGD